MSKEQKVNLVTFLILAGFSISVFYHYVAGAYAYSLYPYTTFLFRPKAAFLDFAYPYKLADNPYEFRMIELTDSELGRIAADATSSPAMYDQGIGGPLYFPVAYRLAWLFTIFGPAPGLVLFLTLFVCLFFFICRQSIQSIGVNVTSSQVFILAFLSYPFLFAFDRANFEIVVFAFLYLFVVLYHSHPKPSLIFLSLAIAMKGFPAVFLVLFLSERKYKEIALTIALALGMTLLGYATYPGGLLNNVTNHLINLRVSNQNFSVGNGGLYFGHSLYGAFKFLTALFSPATDLQVWSAGIQTPYLVLCGIISVGVVAYLMLRERVFWKKVALLVCMMDLIPFVSCDYKLLHLFIPLFLFFKQPVRDSADRFYAIIFGLLLIPKDYFHLPSDPEASSSILLNPLLMLLLVLVIIGSGIKKMPTPETVSQPLSG